MKIIFSSALLRRIWPQLHPSTSRIDFWAGHVLRDQDCFYTYAESFRVSLGERIYRDRQPRLVKSKHQELDRLQRLAIRKVRWQTQRKINKQFSPVWDLNQSLLIDLAPGIFAQLFEQAQEAAQMLAAEWYDADIGSSLPAGEFQDQTP